MTNKPSVYLPFAHSNFTSSTGLLLRFVRRKTHDGSRGVSRLDGHVKCDRQRPATVISPSWKVESDTGWRRILLVGVENKRAVRGYRAKRDAPYTLALKIRDENKK